LLTSINDTTINSRWDILLYDSDQVFIENGNLILVDKYPHYSSPGILLCDTTINKRRFTVQFDFNIENGIKEKGFILNCGSSVPAGPPYETLRFSLGDSLYYFGYSDVTAVTFAYSHNKTFQDHKWYTCEISVRDTKWQVSVFDREAELLILKKETSSNLIVGQDNYINFGFRGEQIPISPLKLLIDNFKIH
jgi:hypothetical protein